MSTALGNKVIEEFCKLCSWAYVSWSIRKYFVDENPDLQYLQNPRYESFFLKLSEITQEHWLLQLTKLHDPSVQNGRINLTVNYIIEYGNWDSNTESELKLLRDEMLMLNTPIRKARNKILSHNDLSSILKGGFLGEFKAGEDVKYFQCLQIFANLIHEKAIGGPFPLDNLARNDVEIFMNCFKKGSAIIDS